MHTYTHMHTRMHTHAIYTHVHTLTPHTGCDEEWALCRRSWLYLEPIFSLEDIMRQLPVEGKRYQTMDRIWRRIMASAQQDPEVLSIRLGCVGFSST